MSTSQNLDETYHAAEMAGLAVYLRAVFARAVAGEPEVVCLRVAVTLDTPGLSVIEFELIERSGHAIAGWSL